MSECHSSARCDVDQQVEMPDGSIIRATVHNVHQMRDGAGIKSDKRFMGFFLLGQRRVSVSRAVGATIWKEREL